MTDTATAGATRVRGPRIGENAARPDGIAKVRGDFAFGNDMWIDGMLFGRTLRSPHPYARIVSVDISAALAMPGVHAVVTADDVPGSKLYGLERQDQPVFASEVVRFHGEAIAAVAADHPETARRACAAINVSYEVYEPLVDPEVAITAAPIHPDGNIFRHMFIRHGRPDEPLADGVVSVEGTYEVGMQDQAFLGPECALGIPSDDGGIELFVSTQWIHADRDQTAACLGLAPEKVRMTMAGVGGAFGGREDISLQIHAALLTLHTGRPVKLQYSREESFFGHVHRHPARMWYRHSARADGTLVKVEARIVMDGGAYASTSSAVLSNASSFAHGPYRVEKALIEGYSVRTNNPSCGAMRGFGAVQTCFAHEAQMDKLAAALAVDPIELRLKNALVTGDRNITGQRLTGAVPVAELIRRCAAAALPAPGDGQAMMARPGGAGRTADANHVVRGVGFAIGWKNLMFSEGFDDYSTARVGIDDGPSGPFVTVHCACAEVGQGFVTLAQQIARTVSGLDEVVLQPADTQVGSAGSTSASRQTWMSGGAVQLACEAVMRQVFDSLATTHDVDSGALTVVDDRIVSADGTFSMPVAEAVSGKSFEATVEHRHAPTVPLDADGQGDAHVSFAFAAHRAVVDVDLQLGLVRVVEVTTTQDVGRLLNPRQAVGQIEGGIAQGVGLAVMEEIIVTGGKVRNASFTDYLIPTALDMPTVTIAALLEVPEPGAPFGAKGIGEPPTIASTAAIAAAIRNATGRPITRVPVRPQDICL
jgi:xanthine dehydrogenase D subunit